MFTRKQLPTFKAVSEGQPALCDIPVGERVLGVYLTLGDDGTASADNGGAPNTTLDKLVTSMNLRLNGKPMGLIPWLKSIFQK